MFPICIYTSKICISLTSAQFLNYIMFTSFMSVWNFDVSVMYNPYRQGQKDAVEPHWNIYVELLSSILVNYRI